MTSTDTILVAPAASVGHAAMAAWVNSFHWNPGPLGGAPLTAEDYGVMVRERGGVETFVALAGDRVIGSLALYPVSALKSGRGAVVWMDSFAVAPEFRHGTVPLRLFVEAFVFCVAHGYDRLDCNASPANPAMVAIVRPAGFLQASTQPCADDRLEFRSYLPLVYRFLAESLGLGDRLVEVVRSWTDFASSPWVPGRMRPTPGGDVHDHHGAPAFRYPMTGSGVDAELVVDLTHDRVTAARWGTLEVDCHPAAGRTVVAGRPASFVHRVVNRGADPVTVEVSMGPRTELVVVPPGEEVLGTTTVPVERAGTHEVELTVVTSVAHAGETRPARLRLHSWVRATAAPRGHTPTTWPRIEEDDERWLVRNRWLDLRIDRVDGTCEIGSATGPGIRELWPDLGPPYPAALKTPPPREIRCVAAEVRDGRAVLTLESPANVWCQRHGRAYHASGRYPVELADAVLRRTFEIGGDHVVSVATSLADAPPAIDAATRRGGLRLRVHPWARGRALTLSVPLADGVFRAPLVYERFPFGMHSLETLGSLDLPRDPDALAESWTACADDDGRCVGLVWERADELRYGLHWMPSLLLTAQSDAEFPSYAYYCGPGDERAVRDAWAVVTRQDAHQPASRAPLAAPVPVRLTVTPTAPAEGDGVTLRGRVTVLSARDRRGTVTASIVDGSPVVLFDGVVAGDHEFSGRIPLPGNASGPVDVRVAWTEDLAVQHHRVGVFPTGPDPVTVNQCDDEEWVLDNGVLRGLVASRFGASLVSLRHDGVELLRSTYPKRRPLGIVAQARGGLGVSMAGLARPGEVDRSSAQETFPWTLSDAAPVETVLAGVTWRGLLLTGESDVDGETVPVELAYLMAPGAPLLLVLPRIGAGSPVSVCVAAHVDPETPWRFHAPRDGGDLVHAPSPAGSNRAVPGGRGLGALAGQHTLAFGAPADTEVVGFRDGDDWSIRALRTAAFAPTCVAVLDEPDLALARVLCDIAESAKSVGSLAD